MQVRYVRSRLILLIFTTASLFLSKAHGWRLPPLPRYYSYMRFPSRSVSCLVAALASSGRSCSSSFAVAYAAAGSTSSAFVGTCTHSKSTGHRRLSRRHLGTYVVHASTGTGSTSSTACASSPNRNTDHATKHKIASSVAKGERRARERQARSRQLCEGCNRPPTLCVCSVLRSVLPHEEKGEAEELVKLATQSTDILILQHPNEFRKRHYSTVPLIDLTLQDVTIRVGYEFNSETLLDSLGIHRLGGSSTALAAKNGDDDSVRRRPLLLFPGEGAIDLHEYVSRQRPILGRKNIAGKSTATPCSSDGGRNLLVLIDGTWAEAKRMAKTSPILLERCQMVQFPPEDSCDNQVQSSSRADNDEAHQNKHHQSVYNALRKEPEAHTISTLEALAQALDTLEPDDDNAIDVTDSNTSILRPSEALRRVLEKHVEAYLNNAITKRSPRFNRDISGAGARNKRTWQIKNDLFTKDGLQEKSGRHTRQGFAADDAGIRTLADGAIIRPLQLADAPQLDAWWEHKSSNSLQMVARCIGSDCNANVGACLGVYGPDGYTLRGGIVRYEGGAVGMLHVDSQYRRRGYGEALLSEATNAIETVDVSECVAYIMEGNVASEKTFQKVGWVREDPSLKGTGKRKANRKWIKRQ